MKLRLLALILIVFICHAVTSLAAETKSAGGKSPKTKTAQMKAFSDPVTGMEFVPVKGGCFMMGGEVNSNEKPAHEVCIDDFYLGKYEVTQAQWVKVMGKNPSSFAACGASCPVDTVSWYDIQDFLKALRAKSKKQYRLPTEAEWEYAARSGGSSDRWAGTVDEARLPDYGWLENNSGGTTHPVGKKEPNRLGLYDMSGNVWEWCQDWYGETFYKDSPKNNPAGPDNSDSRVVRGGAFDNDAVSLRTANRDNIASDTRNANTGFRILFPVK